MAKRAKKNKPPDAVYLKLILHCRLSRLTPYEQNPRINQGAVDATAQSILMHGQIAPIVVDENLRICCGHTRRLAAMSIGQKTFPVMVYRFATEEAFVAYNIQDNRTASLSGWSVPLLQEQMNILLAVGYTAPDVGFQQAEFDDLLEQFKKEQAQQRRDSRPDPDIVPPPPKKAITRPGDLWLLGDRRLLCGDATKDEDVKRLIGKKKIDLFMLDIPYGVDAVTWDKKIWPKRGIDLLNNLKEKYANVNASGYLFGYPERLAPYYEAISWRNKKWIVWLHYRTACQMSGGGGWGRSHDAIIYVSQGEAYFNSDPVRVEYSELTLERTPVGTKHYRKSGRFGPHTFSPNPLGQLPGDVVFFPNIVGRSLYREQEDHPTQKPINLISALIETSCDTDSDIVLDPFVGSGTTIIAAEQLDRKCYAMEICEQYCDVCCERRAKYTGKDPVRQRDGKLWSILKQN